MEVRGIILCGGLSSRMGKNKLDQKINGSTIISKVIGNVEQSQLSDIIIVYGKYDVMTELPKRYNPRFEEGMSTSIIEGMKGFDGDGVMILLGDMPFVGHSIIDKLLNSFEASGKSIIVPTFNKQKGNPVIIGKKYFSELIQNTGDKGARDIIKGHPEEVEWVEVEDKGVLVDIDDEKTLEMVNGESLNAIEEFDINLNKSELICFVGAGGKTTTMFGLAKELKNKGYSVLVTTTTAIFYPKEDEYDEIIVDEKISSIIFNKECSTGINIVGSRVNDEGKLIGIDKEAVDIIFKEKLFDYILVEGDGSKRRSIKAPAEHEPVIPALTTKVVGLIGMDALGMEINSNNVHRPEIFCTVTNCKMGDTVDSQKLFLLVKNANGLFRNSPKGAKKYLKLNKVDEKLHSDAIESIKKEILQCNLDIEKVTIGLIDK